MQEFVRDSPCSDKSLAELGAYASYLGNKTTWLGCDDKLHATTREGAASAIRREEFESLNCSLWSNLKYRARSATPGSLGRNKLSRARKRRVALERNETKENRKRGGRLVRAWITRSKEQRSLRGKKGASDSRGMATTVANNAEDTLEKRVRAVRMQGLSSRKRTSVPLQVLNISKVISSFTI